MIETWVVQNRQERGMGGLKPGAIAELGQAATKFSDDGP